MSLVMALLMYGCEQRSVVAITIGAVSVQPVTASLVEGETLQFEAVVEDVYDLHLGQKADGDPGLHLATSATQTLACRRRVVAEAAPMLAQDEGVALPDPTSKDLLQF